MTFKTTKLRDAITFALVAGATSLVGTGVAFAQDQDQDQESTASETTTRSEEHTSELQSLMRISYAVFCLTKNNKHVKIPRYTLQTNMTSRVQYIYILYD